MTRECVHKLENEFLKIDKHLEKYEKKYGTLFYKGFEYIVCSKEEKEADKDGNPIFTGEAYCSDGIYVEEQLDPDETEDLDQVHIFLDLFYYERKPEGEVILMERIAGMRWKGTKNGGYIGL